MFSVDKKKKKGKTGVVAAITKKVQPFLNNSYFALIFAI